MVFLFFLIFVRVGLFTYAIIIAIMKDHVLSAWSWIIMILPLCTGYGTEPEIITLLDTEQSKWRGWIKNTGDYDGWRTQNIPPNAQLVYGLCEPHKTRPETDNWLQSPYLVRGEANMVQIELQFMMRSCREVARDGGHCESTFQLLVRDRATAPSSPPSSSSSSSDGNAKQSWDISDYRPVGIVSPDVLWENEGSQLDISSNIGGGGSQLNIKLYRVSLQVRRDTVGFHVALRDRGACVMVQRIRVFYNSCPPAAINLAEYPRVVASEHSIHIKGECTKGATLLDRDRSPNMLCQPNGRWHGKSTPFCQCYPGKTPSGRSIRCLDCPINTYKSLYGSSKCSYCPSHSHSAKGSTVCKCDQDFYPFYSRNSLLCAQLPSVPLRLAANTTSSPYVTLQWDPPLITGQNTDMKYPIPLWYRIICTSCLELDYPVFIPNSVVNRTRVRIDALHSGRTYEISVISQNAVSNFSENQKISTATIKIFPLSSVPFYQPRDLRLQQIGPPNSARIFWSPPKLGPLPIRYQLVIYIRGTMFPTVRYLTESYADINLPVLPVAAFVKVRAEQDKGWGDYSTTLLINITKFGQVYFDNFKGYSSHFPIGQGGDSNQSGGTGSGDENDDINRIGWSPGKVLLVFLFGIAVISAVVGVPLCIYCKFLSVRRKTMKKKIGKTRSKETIALTDYSRTHAPSTTKIYIDPSTYEDPSVIIQEFTKEIDPKLINIESVIGEGEFGEVCKGKLRKSKGISVNVAVKTLKANCSEKQRRDFLVEAGIMGQFEHPNVIHLEGVVTRMIPVMIVTRFMENGALDSFLRHRRAQFNLLQLLRMLRGVASGMRYLADMKYVHRDLAARNILVDNNLTCKVSDFGLSREILADNTDGAYTTKGGLIPIRWTAPEAINYRRFTSSSDVWSYGVLMWEVLSYGERPYWNWTNREVLQAIETGYRLPAPANCPPPLHLLMLECWRVERAKRPKFGQLLQSLDCMMRDPETLILSTPSAVANGMPASLCGSHISNNQLLGMRSSAYSLINAYVGDPIVPVSHEIDQCNNSDPVFGPESPVTPWLTCLDLSQYDLAFSQADLTNLGQVAKLSREDLIKLGVKQCSHLSKFISNIEAMRNYFMLPPMSISTHEVAT